MESQIKELKQKYWEGSSTIEEEKLLKQLLKEEDKIDSESGFFTEIAMRKSVETREEFSHPKSKNRILWQLTSVAATVALVIAFSIGFNSNDQNQFAIDDPPQAYEISQQALLLVSSKLNKGKTYSARMDKINEIKNMVSE